jgi:hypothetical protein
MDSHCEERNSRWDVGRGADLFVGSAEVHRTVVHSGVHKQYVYSDGTFVYVDNGRVTAFQVQRQSRRPE